MNIGVEINMQGFTKGVTAAMAFSKRTPAQVVNTSAYWVAVNAKNAMPYVTPDRVDAELSVIESPVIGKRGKPLKRKKLFTPRESNQVPFAALIIAARANPSSYYNRTTGSRYLLTKNPFKGVSRAAGRAAMAALIDKMVKSRHKSGKFLLAGFVPAVQEMAAFAVQKYMPGAPRADRTGYYGGSLGSASPAREGDTVASATIMNRVGMEGRNAASFNKALWEIGAPVLQQAVDDEGRKQMEYALKHAGDEFKALVQPHLS